MGTTPELQQFLEAHKPWFRLLESGKVHCELNGHAFPPNMQCLSAFVQGHKYQRLKKQREAANSLEKYEPFIITSKNFPNMLYCALTGQLLEKSLDAVKRHLKGKRFTKAKEKFEDNSLELRPEPDIGQIVEGLRDEEMAGADGPPEPFWEAGEEGEGPSSSDMNGKDDAMEVSGNSSGQEEAPAARKKKHATSRGKTAPAAAVGTAAGGAKNTKEHGVTEGTRPKKKKVKPPSAKKQKV